MIFSTAYVFYWNLRLPISNLVLPLRIGCPSFARSEGNPEKCSHRKDSRITHPLLPGHMRWPAPWTSHVHPLGLPRTSHRPMQRGRHLHFDHICRAHEAVTASRSLRGAPLPLPKAGLPLASQRGHSWIILLFRTDL